MSPCLLAFGLKLNAYFLGPGGKICTCSGKRLGSGWREPFFGGEGGRGLGGSRNCCRLSIRLDCSRRLFSVTAAVCSVAVVPTNCTKKKLKHYKNVTVTNTYPPPPPPPHTHTHTRPPPPTTTHTYTHTHTHVRTHARTHTHTRKDTTAEL